MRVLPIGCAFVGLLAVPALAGPDDVYVRGARTIEVTLSRIETLCRDRDSGEVLVVFDAPTFAPPNEWSPFRKEYPFATDLPAWIKAIDAWAESKKRKVRVATTLSREPILVRGAWGETILKELPAADLRRTGAYPPLRTGAKWIDKLTEPLRPRATVVLVAGELLPEESSTAHSSARGQQQGGVKQSRTLFPVGTYWDPEEIAAILGKRRLFLDVVAPEARFGRCCALQEMPQLPWVTRPVVGSLGTLRFGARMNVSDHYNTDLPSGYGVWCYARVAVATGGKYLLYPFGAGEWLDVCPFDPEQRTRLAPEVEPLDAYLKSLEGDPALDALCKATALVRKKTPWFAGVREDAPDHPWIAFESISPIRVSKHYDPSIYPRSRRPGIPLSADLHESAKARAAVYLSALPAYDEAIALLERTKAAIDSGALANVRPRSAANVRLASFWFGMAAFHLEAAGLGLLDAELDLPDDISKPKDLSASVIEDTVLRLSDCLDPLERGTTEQGAEKPFRAPRPLEEALARVDQRQLPRAKQVIAAARDVCAREACSPWGWAAYYSELVDFRVVWTRQGKHEPPRARPGSKTKSPKTPPPPPPVVKPGSQSPAPSSG